MRKWQGCKTVDANKKELQEKASLANHGQPYYYQEFGITGTTNSDIRNNGLDSLDSIIHKSVAVLLRRTIFKRRMFQCNEKTP